MRVITTHKMMDFDGLASLICAAKLYPDAVMALPAEQTAPVRDYLALYKDTFPFVSAKDVTWEEVNHLVIVDTNNVHRTDAPTGLIKADDVCITVYDHHALLEEEKSDVIQYYVERTGAAVTILLEELIKQQIPLSSYEVTLFALGLYTDTGSFMYPSTTVRDLQAAVYLKENGMDLDVVQQFAERSLSEPQQNAFQSLLQSAEHVPLEGLDIVIVSMETDNYIAGLNDITSKVLEMTGAHAVFNVTQLKNKVVVIARAASDRINVLPLIKTLSGGGHEKAAAATIKNAALDETLPTVKEQLPSIITRALNAETLMSSPVKTLEEETTIDEAKQQMLHFGHNGFPIINHDGNLAGVISRRDVDKAHAHGLGHAPVKGFMTKNPVTITKRTSFEEMQQQMISHNIGRLPVLEKKRVVGIVTRSDVVEHMHQHADNHLPMDLTARMREYIPSDYYQLIQTAGRLAAGMKMEAYLIGGIVRDILLKKPNEDVDIVIEGDGTAFADAFAKETGGSVTLHDTFQTATISTNTGRKIDVSTSRAEYYEEPAALPVVVRSRLKEDLSRRDFTLNAMAISLSPESFGTLIDYYNGHNDMQQKRLRVLHNLSFVEDPTRILRGIRFEQRFSFHMDPQTKSFLRYATRSIALLSHTRIVADMKRLFDETDPVKSIARLHELGVLEHFLPGAVWNEKASASLQALLGFLQTYPRFIEAEDKWFFVTACLYTDSERSADTLENIAVTKPQKKTAHHFITWLQHDSEEIYTSFGTFHHAARSLEDGALLLAAASAAGSQQENKASFILSYIKKRQHMPAWISGDDIKARGAAPGPAFADYLLAVEKATLDDDVKNRQEALAYLDDEMRKKEK
ncbi:tRNA nucleotidyltransferase (CCA-adding enzyme) [Alteribacillus persepolensis]|uniref:tRNA nucleotidyltransferase (CCA-adding enzyme) n=1 Tax=Alteribacillus persepolensis TaxID=568899 RepID=A0A1G8H1P5_9BACI|nr:CBS domain-containing protein [Alteribacillus persepolensis]SDI00489.1 tRNA nucleotidyltransferase (CCA-adding enzyme) [Alteribacillus persepolensis]